MPGSVASGTLCIIYSVKHNFCKYNQLHVSATIYVHPHAECEEKNENKIFAAVYEIGVLVWTFAHILLYRVFQEE